MTQTKINTNAAEIQSGLDLFHNPGDVFEMRILNAVKPNGYKIGTVSGYFDSTQTAADELMKSGWIGRATVYHTQNAINPDLLARAYNRLIERPKATTADTDVLRFTTLLIDIDPKRASQISATDDEMQSAIERAERIAAYLAEWHFQPIIKGMSGNGAYLCYRLDAAPTEANGIIIQDFLKAVADRFDDDAVEVDTSVFNPARIQKVFGTIATKGDSIPSRPHRKAYIIEANADAPVVSLDDLIALTPAKAETKPQASYNGTGTPYTQDEIKAALSAKNIDYSTKNKDGITIYQLDKCLTSDAHDDGASVFFDNGKAGYKCFHRTCESKGWQDVKAVLFPGGRHGGAVNSNGKSSAVNGTAAMIEAVEVETVTAVSAKVEDGEIGLDEFLLSESAADEGNAQCVNRVFPGKFLYCNALGWLTHNGRYWQSQNAEATLTRAIVETLRQRRVLAVNRRVEALVLASKLSARNVRNCKALFESLVTESVGNFDNDSDVLNCRNGVVNLRTGKITPHDASQRFTHCIDIDYDPAADDSAWIDWLHSAITPKGKEDDSTYIELMLWLQKAVGYSITGRTNEHIMVYLHGPGRAGKGLFCQTLARLLGRPLASSVDFDTFTAKRGGDSQNFDLAPLRPSRLITASESDRANMLNAKMVKAITGDDPIYCAFKHRDHFEYVPQFKIWLASNFKIMADADDDALWSRLRVVTFPTSHIGKEDLLLKEKLWKHRAGILAWAVAGAIEWYSLLAAGKGLGRPQVINDATSDHKADNDKLGQFISDCCITGDDKYAKSSLFNAAYRQWCTENGYQALGAKRVTESMQKKGFERKQTKEGNINLGQCWQSIGLLA